MPLNITFFQKDSKLCAASESAKWSPIIGTSVTIVDITADVIKDSVVPESKFCIYLSGFPQTCAPFNFSIQAFSKCVTSPQAQLQGNGIVYV